MSQQMLGLDTPEDAPSIANDADSPPPSGRRRLTYTGDFSLKQMESLTKVLDTIAPAAGDRNALRKAIAAAYPKIAAGAKREGNVLLSLIAHGLVNSDTLQLTDLANDLLALPNETERLNQLAKYILRTLQQSPRSRARLLSGHTGPQGGGCTLRDRVQRRDA